MRLFRALLLFKLGFWAGTFASASLLKRALVGGIALRVPADWRVESDVQSLAGGVPVDVSEPDDPNAPTLRVTGYSAFGGIAVGARPIES